MNLTRHGGHCSKICMTWPPAAERKAPNLASGIWLAPLCSLLASLRYDPERERNHGEATAAQVPRYAEREGSRCMRHASRADRGGPFVIWGDILSSVIRGLVVWPMCDETVRPCRLTHRFPGRATPSPCWVLIYRTNHPFRSRFREKMTFVVRSVLFVAFETNTDSSSPRIQTILLLGSALFTSTK